MSRLLADIGGTNARFALQQGGVIGPVTVLACADYPTLQSAIRHYLADRQVQDAGIAIATPITGDAVRMTNHHWQFSIAALRAALGLQTLRVVNDFEALAMAIPSLDSARDCEQIGAAGTAVDGAPIALVGPGTGLGVAGLVQVQGHWQALAGEGGHASFAPGSELEARILAEVSKHYAHVSAERLLCGSGLVLIYQTLHTLAGSAPEALDSAQITARALSQVDAVCEQTLAAFTGMLGAFCGNVVLTFGSRGGLYLGGGILGKLGAAFDHALFRQRFEAKGRFAGYLAQIPVRLIIHPAPAFLGISALLGRRLAAD